MEESVEDSAESKSAKNWTREDNTEIEPGFTPHEASEIAEEMKRLEEEIPFFSGASFIAHKRQQKYRAEKMAKLAAAIRQRQDVPLDHLFAPPDVTDSLMFPADD